MEATPINEKDYCLFAGVWIPRACVAIQDGGWEYVDEHGRQDEHLIDAIQRAESL